MSSKKKSKKVLPKKQPVKLEPKVYLVTEEEQLLMAEIRKVRDTLFNDKKVKQAVQERVMNVFDRLVEAMTYQLVSASKAGNLIMETSFAQIASAQVSEVQGRTK